MKKVLEEARSLQEQLIDHRRFLHQNPEIGMELPVTVAYVKEELIKMGYTPEEIGQSGLIATVGGKNSGKVILLRADMDGLPIREEVDEKFKSENGNMHACGHDFHTTMLLGAAKILKEHEKEIKGTVKLMFQPGEEVLMGAKAMIDAGILENPKVDAAVMFHVFTGFGAPAGMVVVPNAGASSAASDRFEIMIKGKGGHGAMPERTIDPLNVMSHIHIALQSINSREITCTDSAVVTVGMMAGGTAPNIIPDTATMKGTIRTFSEENRKFIHQRIKDIAEGIAKTFRAEAKVNIIEGCPALVNDQSLIDSAKEALIDSFGPHMVLNMVDVIPSGKIMSSEDFSFVSHKVPSLMLAMMAGDSKNGYIYPVHHPKAKFDEDVLYKGAAAYANIAMHWLNHNS